MSQPSSPKISGNDQERQKKVLGGMPPKKEPSEIMKVNTPAGKKAPDSFTPGK